MTSPSLLADGLGTVGEGFDKLRTVAERHELGDQAFRLAQRATDLCEPLMIMIVGDGNFGKSSLVNALLGTKAAAVGVLPTTATVDLYINAEPHGAEIRWTDGDKPTRAAISEAHELLATAKADEREVLQVRWNVDAEWPARSDVALVDTPGISQFRDAKTRTTTKMYRSEGLELERRDQFEQYFFRADAVVWCIRSDRFEADSIVRDLAAVRGEDKLTLGLLTCIDRIHEDRRDEVVDRAKEFYGDHLTTFITVSTKEDASLRKWETVAHLRTELDARVIDRADLVKQQAALRALVAESEELAEAIATLAKGLHEGLEHRRKLLVEADRGADRVMHGVRSKAQGVLDHQERAAVERAGSIMASASSSSAARSELTSRAVDVHSTRAALSTVLADAATDGANLMEERRHQIEWTTVVVGGGTHRSGSVRRLVPTAPHVSIAAPQFSGLDSHGIWDFAMQFDFMRNFAQNAILKQARTAIAKAFATMSDETDGAVDRYDGLLRSRLTDQVEGSFTDHFGAKAPGVATQILGLLASAHTLIGVLGSAEPVAASIDAPDLLAGAVARAVRAAGIAEAAFRFVTADLIARQELASTGPPASASAWLDDLTASASAGSPSAASQVEHMITKGTNGSASHLCRLVLALPTPTDRARIFGRSAGRFSDEACTTLLRANASGEELTAALEDELIRRARSNAANAERLQSSPSVRVRAAAKAELLQRDRTRAIQIRHAMEALSSVEIVADLPAWQREVDQAITDLERWLSKLRPESKKGLVTEIDALAERRSQLLSQGRAKAVNSNAAYDRAMEAAAKARSQAVTLHTASFWIWGASVLMLMIPGMAGLAVLVWLGSLVLWLVMRQQRETLQQPDAWRRYFNPDNIAPAAVVPQSVAAPPNWYPDPTGERRWRYWDGQQWTDRTAD